ncbi:MAG: glucose-1-phosphate cytidylyltransferase [Candidatus Eisenbacteria sp.]|nr:glucose-1-phosphate cytidylyltransferase [Candidatus Eisenbacteria bacterium]
MKTVILAGGLGTRLRDIAVEVPKPMVPIGERPILYHLMKYYSLWGYKEFVLCLGYKSAEVKNFLVNSQLYMQDATLDFTTECQMEFHDQHLMQGWRITMAETGVQSLTATRIRRIGKYVREDPNFMLTYADGLGNVDIQRLVKFHLSHGKIMTVTGVIAPSRFGEMIVDDSGRVNEFNEKPTGTVGRISGGFFVCRRELLDYLPEDEDVMMEQEPMRRLAADGQMMIFAHDGFWHPMDTPRDYEFLNKIYFEGDAPWTHLP